MLELTQSRPPDSTLVIPSSPAQQADGLPDATSESTQSLPPDSALVILSPAQQADEPPDELLSNDIAVESYPRLTDSHLCRDQWPSWMIHAVTHLEEYNGDAKWRQLLLLWLEFEDKMGYPYGQVS